MIMTKKDQHIDHAGGRVDAEVRDAHADVSPIAAPQEGGDRGHQPRQGNQTQEYLRKTSAALLG
jgi:hypothetical protein